MILTMLDTIGIQNYIFNSNKLKEIYAGSYLIKRIFQEEIPKLLDDMGLIGNEDWNDLEKSKEVNFNNDYEIIYLGGGNGYIIFNEKINAENFTKRITRKAIKEYPGINLAVLNEEFETGTLKEKFEESIFKLNKYKQKKEIGISNISLPIFERCGSDGLPSTKIYKEESVSASTKVKLENADNANNSLKNGILKNVQGRMPYYFDDFGQKEGNSYIAIVHADGNNMGQKIMNLMHDVKDDETFIKRSRNFSILISKVNTNAIKTTIEKITEDEKINKNKNLPLRPIIYGGDDLTVVTRGDLGLKFCEIFAKELRNEQFV